MPHPDYGHRFAIEVACSGTRGDTTTTESPHGPIRDKEGATLAYAIADVREWSQRKYGTLSMGGDCLRESILLEEPTRAQLLDVVAEASSRLNAHNDHSYGGTLDFYFSGHGSRDGALCLADGVLDADELADSLATGNTHPLARHVRMVLDCCHSGMTLARLLMHSGHWVSYVLRDAWAASLPSERAFELVRLGHGVLTYVKTRPDPFAVTQEWTAAGYRPTDRDLRDLDRLSRETAHFLTSGEQHALDLTNGHSVCVLGSPNRHLELNDHKWSLPELVEALDGLPRLGRR